MKDFFSINYAGDQWDMEGYGFDKLDGSNLRFEWNKKREFYKYGSRSVLIDENTEIYGEGVKIFKEKYQEPISKILRDQYKDIQSVVCFAEFLGDNSSFGQHITEKHDTVLFDISLYKKGFMKPREFIENFGHLGIPEIVYKGKLTPQFVYDVQQGHYNVKEGVIFKTAIENKKHRELLYYCKIKTLRWLEELRSRYGDKAVEEELKRHEK